jgi:hypothetical protein
MSIENNPQKTPLAGLIFTSLDRNLIKGRAAADEKTV